MDAIFVGWLTKATIKFDKSGKLSELKEKITDLSNKIVIPQSEKDSFWQKINYNVVANNRYFESGDPIYHQALEMRLLYSVSEVLTGYFVFRDILWRGEKTAIKYLKENDADFYEAFTRYTEATNLEDRFKAYNHLLDLVFTTGYERWKKGDVWHQAKDRSRVNEQDLIEYWKKLVN
jgi:hypothetical protein